MFKISINKKIRKQILRFPISVQDKVECELSTIIKLDHPIQHRDVKKLRGCSSFFRLKIGIHIRVVFEIIKTAKLIRIIEVNTRENIRY